MNAFIGSITAENAPEYRKKLPAPCHAKIVQRDGYKTVGNQVKDLESRSIIHKPEFGGIYITAGIEEFNKLGFKCGDSVDVIFSNGYALKDLPYYNGYYTAGGEPLLIERRICLEEFQGALRRRERIANRAGHELCVGSIQIKDRIGISGNGTS